jgi:hypothetical protein
VRGFASRLAISMRENRQSFLESGAPGLSENCRGLAMRLAGFRAPCGVGIADRGAAHGPDAAGRQIFCQVPCQALVKFFTCFVKFFPNISFAVLWTFKGLRVEKLLFDENRFSSSFWAARRRRKRETISDGHTKLRGARLSADRDTRFDRKSRLAQNLFFRKCFVALVASSLLRPDGSGRSSARSPAFPPARCRD